MSELDLSEIAIEENMESQQPEKEHISKATVGAKGRITLGKLAEKYSSFDVYERRDGVIELHPNVEISAKDAWVYSKEVSDHLDRAIKRAKEDGPGIIMSVDELLGSDSGD